jgi:hypothetical protein
MKTLSALLPIHLLDRMDDSLDRIISSAHETSNRIVQRMRRAAKFGRHVKKRAVGKLDAARSLPITAQTRLWQLKPK